MRMEVHRGFANMLYFDVAPDLLRIYGNSDCFHLKNFILFCFGCGFSTNPGKLGLPAHHYQFGPSFP
jgi:hypothetical protein